MQSLGIYNIKGGVGKTTTAVNLSYLSGADGTSTLLWDLDPQGSSTYYFQKKTGIDASTKKILTGKAELEEFIQPTIYPNLSIIPADLSFRNMDIILDDVKKSKKKLKEVTKQLKNSCDRLIIDCPPGITLLSENVFHASDFLIVPTVPTPLSLRTYDQITRFFKENELDSSMIITFFSMVEIRKNLHKEALEDIKNKIHKLCREYIPYISEIEKMGTYREPVCARFPKSRASQAYFRLWEELKTRYLEK